jgi:RNA polymerase sigma-70 factor (ECF subfamily)
LANYHRTKAQIEAERQEVRAAQRNPRRFAVLYERYYEPVFLFLIKRVGNEETTADLCSQVFLKAMLNLKRYRFQGLPFSSWLFRIAINEMNQYFRKTKNQRSVSLESVDLQVLMEEVEEKGNEQNMQKMIALLDQLNQDEVQLVELRYFEKMPFKEIAMIYNITENNAKVRMYRLLAKMKNMIDGKV